MLPASSQIFQQRCSVNDLTLSAPSTTIMSEVSSPVQKRYEAVQQEPASNFAPISPRWILPDWRDDGTARLWLHDFAVLGEGCNVIACGAEQSLQFGGVPLCALCGQRPGADRHSRRRSSCRRATLHEISKELSVAPTRLTQLGYARNGNYSVWELKAKCLGVDLIKAKGFVAQVIAEVFGVRLWKRGTNDNRLFRVSVVEWPSLVQIGLNLTWSRI
eukprot:gene27245-32915_t